MNMPSSSTFRIGITKPQSGFTLLELVLVLFIVALIATTPLLFIDNQDNQIRYDETLQKMQMIRDAIIQRQEYRNQPVLSGFVIDNGVLPPASTEGTLYSLINYDPVEGTWLASSDGDFWQVYGAITPYLKLDSTAIELTGFSLNKGYRTSYITKGLDSQNQLKDGWGNDFSIITPDSSTGALENSYSVEFTSQEQPLYNNVVKSISSDDWMVSLDQIHIELINNSTTSNAIGTVALLVFNNTDSTIDADRWNTFHYEATVPNSTTSASGGILQLGKQTSINAEWKLNNEASAALPATKIPVGDHLVLFKQSGTADPITTPHDIIRVLPGSTQPTVTLLVSPE
jgi:prepilin-type N-terminal cleavage/methylation domain-containing protein